MTSLVIHKQEGVVIMVDRKTFTLRIDEKLLNRLHYASAKNQRSATAQIIFLVERFLEDFEKENGAIPLSDEQ